MNFALAADRFRGQVHVVEICRAYGLDGNRGRWLADLERYGSPTVVPTLSQRTRKNGAPFPCRRLPRSKSESVEDQYSRGDHRGPQRALVAYGGLGHVGGADDFVGQAIDLL